MLIVAIILAVVGSTVLYKIVNAFVTIRADETEEINGLDISEHGERGYTETIFTGVPNFIAEDFSSTSSVFNLNSHSTN